MQTTRLQVTREMKGFTTCIKVTAIAVEGSTLNTHAILGRLCATSAKKKTGHIAKVYRTRLRQQKHTKSNRTTTSVHQVTDTADYSLKNIKGAEAFYNLFHFTCTANCGDHAWVSVVQRLQWR